MIGRPGSLAPRVRRGATIVAICLLALVALGGPWAARPVVAASGIDVTLPTGHTISGRVTGPGGTPLAGVDVQAQGQSSGSGEGISAADGTFTVHGLADDTYVVDFVPARGTNYLARYYGAPTSAPEGDQTGAVPVVVAGAGVAGIDGQLDAGTTISGIVTGVAGAPVTNIQVNAYGGSGGSTTVRADGAYELVGLFPGVYSLYIYTPTGGPYKPGAVSGGTIIQDQFAGSPIDVSAGAVTGVNFTVPVGTTISGHVTGGDGPVEVDANESSGGFGFGATVTSATGDFTIGGLWPGSYSILFGVPPDPSQPDASSFPYGAYADGALVDQNSPTPVDASAGDVHLSPITIPAGAAMSGTIRGGGAPLARAYVSICDVNGALGCVATYSAADGAWRIGHFETGDWIVQVSGPHHAPGFYGSGGYVADRSAATPVHIDAGGPNVGSIGVDLPSGGSISGRITGPTGEPIVDAQVSASGSNGIGPGGAGNGSCTTGADGRYLCDGLPTDLYTVLVSATSTDPAHPGSAYVGGGYDATAPGHYTADFNAMTLVMVADPNDHVPPTVLSGTPASGATGVPRDATVTARFSEGVLGVTGKSVKLIDTKNGQDVEATVSYDTATRIATLRPKALLAGHEKYRVVLTKAITDWNGNPLAATGWTFTTTSDTTAPRVTARAPRPGATGVSPFSFIDAIFSEPVRGVDATSFTVVEKVTGLTVLGHVSYDPGTRTAVFDASPSGGLQSNTVYVVTLMNGITDIAGNPLARTVWTFQTGS